MINNFIFNQSVLWFLDDANDEDSTNVEIESKLRNSNDAETNFMVFTCIENKEPLKPMILPVQSK